MLTDLFAATSGLDPRRVAAAIPPACNRGVEHGPVPAIQADTAVMELPECRPRHPARHLVPAASLFHPGECSFRFEVSVAVRSAWSPWIATATVGRRDFEAMPDRTGSVVSKIDVVTSDVPVERVRLRIRVHPASALAAPWLVTLSACDLAPDEGSADADAQLGSTAAGTTIRLSVPPLSQMDQAPALRDRICAPTSLAMVLAHHGHPAAVGPLAAEVYHPALDLYGVWPAGVRAASRRGVAAYLLRFPDWEAAAWCLAHDLPLILSIRYKARELTGAAVGQTAGHLLVLTGLDGADVLVNDPAAATVAEVPRRYARAEMSRVWLERAGIGYVLFGV